MFSLSGQSPKVQANKNRDNFIRLDNRIKSSTTRHTDRTGILSVPRIYSEQEQIKIKDLASINYSKEFQRPNTVIRQSRMPTNVSSSKEHKEKFIPPKCNEDRFERVASAQNQMRGNNYYFSLSNQDAFFRETQQIYKNGCTRIAIENLKNSEFIRSKVLSNKEGMQLQYKNPGNLTMNANSPRFISNIILMDQVTAYEKGAEAFLSKATEQKKFGASTASKNEWRIEKKKPSLINHSGYEYNPINPLLLNVGKTKVQLQEISDNRQFYKPKVLSGFIDLNRNGAPNHNGLFREEFRKNATCFHKTKGICSNFYDTHRQYKNICEKPFFK